MADQRGDHRLGWLGTGRMGAALARRLLAAGCDVSVYNRTRARAQPLADDGGQGRRPPRPSWPACDIVFATVGTSEDLLDAVLGPGGLLSGTRVPPSWSTAPPSRPTRPREIRERLAARGTALLAAPVMGNPRVARAGG